MLVNGPSPEWRGDRLLLAAAGMSCMAAAFAYRVGVMEIPAAVTAELGGCERRMRAC